MKEFITTRFNKYKLYLVWGLLSVYAGCSVSYLLNLMTSQTIFSQSAFTLPLFVILAFLLLLTYRLVRKVKDKHQKRRRIFFSFLFSYLLALTFVMGYQLRMEGMTSLGVKGKLFILLVSGGVALAFIPFSNCWFQLLDKVKRLRSTPVAHFSRKTNTRIFWISFAVIFLCWIPVFLAYYPAIMSYDFHRQSQEAYQGWIWFNTHHPLVHTTLIRWFFLLGEQLGSYEVGMALFSLLQMLILSAVLAYSCNMIGRLTGKKWPVVVSVLIFGLLPIHPVLALSVTKDILFTAFFLLFVLLILERRLCNKKLPLVFLDIALVLTGILVNLFRNNAFYAMVIFAVIYVLWSKRERLRVALLCVLLLVGSQAAKTTIQNVMDAGTGSKMEMYSVFVQQMARAAIYHEDFLTEDDYATIDSYIPQKYWKNYNPAISDSIKAHVTVTTFQVWKDDIPGMLGDWFRIGLKYPNDYIDAFLAITSGYWFLDDVSHAEVLTYGDDTNLGLLYTFNASKSDVFDGIESHSYFPWLLKTYQKIVNGNCYYEWPVVNNLFKPAFYCWMLLLTMLSLWYLKEGNKQVLCLLPLIYLLTLFLGPVVNMRYAYPIIAAIPFLLAWLFSDISWTKNKPEKSEETMDELVENTNHDEKMGSEI